MSLGGCVLQRALDQRLAEPAFAKGGLDGQRTEQ
jgi:hypothetical protein